MATFVWCDKKMFLLLLILTSVSIILLKFKRGRYTMLSWAFFTTSIEFRQQQVQKSKKVRRTKVAKNVRRPEHCKHWQNSCKFLEKMNETMLYANKLANAIMKRKIEQARNIKQASAGLRIASRNIRRLGKSPSSAPRKAGTRTFLGPCTRSRLCWSNASRKNCNVFPFILFYFDQNAKLTDSWPNCAPCQCAARSLEAACRKSLCSGRKWSNLTEIDKFCVKNVQFLVKPQLNVLRKIGFIE